MDLIKTRLMNTKGEGIYSGPLDCFVKTLKNEGLMAFYKGYLVASTRTVCWNMIFFIMNEEMNGHLDTEYIKTAEFNVKVLVVGFFVGLFFLVRKVR
mmetsp:Transcript_26989/g.23877  ORF Transcript_26989/g.23877 Transcript_26989/m.23877 type:complete len:97 (+) Transcript_26989:777-1067(+)